VARSVDGSPQRRQIGPRPARPERIEHLAPQRGHVQPVVVERVRVGLPRVRAVRTPAAGTTRCRPAAPAGRPAAADPRARRPARPARPRGDRRRPPAAHAGTPPPPGRRSRPPRRRPDRPRSAAALRSPNQPRPRRLSVRACACRPCWGTRGAGVAGAVRPARWAAPGRAGVSAAAARTPARARPAPAAAPAASPTSVPRPQEIPPQETPPQEIPPQEIPPQETPPKETRSTTGSPGAAGSPSAGSPAAGSPAAGSPAAGSPAAGSPAAGGPKSGSPPEPRQAPDARGRESGQRRRTRRPDPAPPNGRVAPLPATPAPRVPQHGRHAQAER